MEVSLQENLATVVPAPGSSLTPAAMSDAIRGAGFRPGKVTVEALGEGKRVGGGWEFRLPGGGAAYLAAAGAWPEGRVRIRATIDPGGATTIDAADAAP